MSRRRTGWDGCEPRVLVTAEDRLLAGGDCSIDRVHGCRFGSQLSSGSPAPLLPTTLEDLCALDSRLLPSPAPRSANLLFQYDILVEPKPTTEEGRRPSQTPKAQVSRRTIASHPRSALPSLPEPSSTSSDL